MLSPYGKRKNLSYKQIVSLIDKFSKRYQTDAPHRNRRRRNKRKRKWSIEKYSRKRNRATK